jgi:hypothetical protein
MRAIIATDFDGYLRKLIWLTENQTGVSAGICERTPNPHATYHADGRFHCKIKSKGRVLKLTSQKKPPLTAIATTEQLLGTASFYVENTMKRLPRFRPDRRVDALLVLGQSVFRDIGCASFNIYDEAGNVIQTHEHAGDFREPQRCVNTKASASGTTVAPGEDVAWARHGSHSGRGSS